MEFEDIVTKSQIFDIFAKISKFTIFWVSSF